MNKSYVGGESLSGYMASLKSMDTEETVDLVFYRRVGYSVARLAGNVGITPNAITCVAIILGVGSAVAFYFNDFSINLLGAALLVWANVLDSADGQLARLTGQFSRMGRILDGVCGDIWFIGIYASICLRENAFGGFMPEYPWAIWLLAAVTGFFHAVQAATADCYRQFHLFFIKGEGESEFESSKSIAEKYSALSWKQRFWQKLMLAFYLNYTRGQEKRTPGMMAFLAKLRDVFGTKIPAKIREEVRRESLPLMKYTNILTFNTRCFALFAAILIFRMPWLYFVFELTVLNCVLVYMIWRHEKMCRKFRARLIM